MVTFVTRFGVLRRIRIGNQCSLLKERRNMTAFRCAEDQLRTGLLETYDGVLNIDKEPYFISVPFGGSLEILVQLQRVLSVTFSLNSPLILKNENI